MAFADRDLLFGMLALQNGMINQGQLVAAFQAWTLEKARLLPEHLVARGDLDADQRDGVEAMVWLHLKKHGGDAGRSLAAIPAARSSRESLARAGDADIGASIAHIGSGETQAGEDLNLTVNYSVGAATSDGQRFRILRPHAKGGLGAVFVALDSELHREVALKQILDQHADDPVSRQRFLTEAEITGGLEHPGIVPVYGLGTYGDGRPYYAMRFVRGDSLKEAVDLFHRRANTKSPDRFPSPPSGEGSGARRGHDGGAGQAPAESRDLELRKLLRRFVDVCNAIDYAHSRGVLHRDIKPSNVIVGTHGETLVVDWGLAKSVGRSDPDPGSAERTLIPSSASGSAETLPGSAMGTPAYMSPEQAAGDLGTLGPRSDVYSLGATLYSLLTGQPPYAGDAGEVLRAVQRGEFPPPRTLDPSIDPALAAVCLKAMARSPEDRYATPRAMAEDVERWMADEPVTAWREPFSRRARRWARRNRTVVTTAAAAVLVALAGTATVLGVQTRANRDLREANARTLRERDLAQQNFDMARRAVDDYLTRVGENPLLQETGLHGLRRELLEAALGYYREFLLQRGDDPKLRADAAAAYERVGVIFLIELGHFSEALAAYNQALALIEPLVRERPGDPVLATARVRLHAGQLHAFKDGDQYPEAIAAFDRAKGLGEGLLAAGGGTEDLLNVLARTYVSATIVFRLSGRVDDALRASLRAHALAEQATRDYPTSLPAARTRLHAATNASHLLRNTGRADESRQLCEQDIAFGKARVREHPRNVEIRNYLASLENSLGQLEKNTGRPLEALELTRSAADSLAALARENPLLIGVRKSLANTLFNLSQLQTDLGQYAEAEQSARAMIDISEALVREVPTSSYNRSMAGSSYGSLGKVLLKAGSQAEALAMLKKAIAIMEASVDSDDLYNMACNLALASTFADPAEGPAATDRQRRDAARAIATLRRVIAAGFADSSSMKTDPDFASLQSRPDFQDLLMDLAFPADPLARESSR